MFVAQLNQGDIISNDIYFNNILLLKAGTIINQEVIRKLEIWGISKINVISLTGNYSPHIHEAPTKVAKKREKIFYSKELFDIKQMFYEGLQHVVSEARYGYVLHNDKQLQWLENLFISVTSDYKILSALLSLKKVDEYSYYHSFDVFLLGSLLADVSGIKDIKSFAISCLIHDIGKLKLPRDLLNKEGKLTKGEFVEIQRHTEYGIAWRKEKGFPEKYDAIIKSHHERLDGSGYPDYLTAPDISSEVRIVSIVDTYSALTLKRAYRDPLTSTKAIELLLNKTTKFDIQYIINFIELLNIYPTDSIVKLSNGKIVRVKFVNENQPYRPILEELDGSRTFELPINLSVTIPRFVKWDQIVDRDIHNDKSELDKHWAAYLNNLMNGNTEAAVVNFQLISQGMTIEDVFIDIIVKSIKEIGIKGDEGQLSVGEEHDALLGIKQILEVAFNNGKQ